VSLNPAAREALEALYREVDAEVASTRAVCWLRGDCCDFEHSEHVLYVSSLELAYVREGHPEPFAAGSVLCPFWKGDLCTERRRRPLGCRTYFCDPAFREELERIHEKYHARLKRIAEEHDLEYRYEPFVAVLREGGIL
jgi:Fe-S-cluster containining protein